MSQWLMGFMIYMKQQKDKQPVKPTIAAHRCKSLYVRISEKTFKEYAKHCLSLGLSQSFVAEKMINEYLSNKK